MAIARVSHPGPSDREGPPCKTGPTPAKEDLHCCPGHRSTSVLAWAFLSQLEAKGTAQAFAPAMCGDPPNTGLTSWATSQEGGPHFANRPVSLRGCKSFPTTVIALTLAVIVLTLKSAEDGLLPSP